MKTIEIDIPEGFLLGAASQFYAGFTPGGGMAAAAVDRLTLAFRVDGSFEAAAVALRQEGDSLIADYTGTDDQAGLRRQLARILGLEVNGRDWHEVGRRDPVVGYLQSEFPGFFTAAKPSPYDAATWGVIAPRMSMHAAAKLKMAIAAKHGDAVELHGRVHFVFPSPRQLLGLDALDEFPGLPPEKALRLRAVAEAADRGMLDAERLRAMPELDALSELQTIRGVGPWTASHILHRGAANRDALPTAEPRVLHAAAAAYGIDLPSEAGFARLAEAWRPFRMWVCVLLMRHLQKVGGWNRPELGKQRAASGRRLKRRVA